MTCVNCPTNWKFWYMNHAVWKYGKSNVYFQDLQRAIESAQSRSDIPAEVLEDFEGQEYNRFIYLDTSIAILESVSTKEDLDLFHLLVFPVEHIEGLSIFDYPDLLIKMYCAGDQIAKLTGLTTADYGLSTKMVNDYMPHAHLHIQGYEAIPSAKVRDMLYPEFYKDSQFY